MPCVLTTDLRLNEPRFVSLPNIMKAKSKHIESIAVADLGVELFEHTKQLSVSEPSPRAKGIHVDSAASLVDLLKKEGVL